ncbi:MAG TPA: hypothetical protein ENH55_15160 [Aurantimonas coralicida]|uniref:Glycerophosphoryl diester phosphodiesterase membrane domain-containing protein n=2 Tax=root TaxID=1 RepID=A0A9C9TIT7_9HYPH|nr:hypothetical protein [Aurantimonas coralicida]HEU02644.1 hypothetical protein [Aurantimonas coralicida]
MTNTADGDQPAFDVKSRLWNTFQIFRARFGFFAGVGVAANLLTVALAYLLQQLITAGSDGGHAFRSPQSDEHFLIWLLLRPLVWSLNDPVGLIVGPFLSALFVMGAYDVQIRRPIDWSDYFRASLQQIVPLVSISFVVVLLVFTGAVMLIVPGLWLLGMFSVVIPAVVVDRAGFEALGRSRSLTKGYRWPIVGFIALVSLVALIETVIVMGLKWLLGVSTIFVMLQVILSGLTAAIGSIAAAVIHMRLREIKENLRLSA